MYATNKTGRFGVPTSPWAERYGIPDKYHISLVKEDPILHSGFAPLLPTLPARYYDKVPREDEFEIANTFGEIDSILVTEECQRSFMQGLTSWNLPPLNTTLSWDGCPPLLGGHRPGDEQRYYDLLKEYYQQRIEVYEDSWLPFFCKNRWYDLLLDKADKIENEDGTKWYIRKWSVDDERIWSHMRFVLEIANRILLAMIRDNNRWLEMMLYGRIQLEEELYGDGESEKHDEESEKRLGNRIIVPLSEDRQLSNGPNKVPPTVKPDPDPEKRIQFVNDLLRNLTWTFLENDSDSHGLTFHMPGNNRFHQMIIRLSVSPLILVCGGTISVAERCIIYVTLAITMECPSISGECRNIPAAVALIQFPSKMGISGESTLVKYHPALRRDAPITSYYLPAALLWRLQSKAFWDAPVNGKRGFLFPRLITGVMQHNDLSGNYLPLGIVVNPDAARDLRFSDVVTRWNEQVRLWVARRPWYREAFATWKTTPWGFTFERILIEVYIEGFKLKDEGRCSYSAKCLERLIREDDVTALPIEDETILPKYDTREGGPQLWLLHCLGTLMLAALPMRKRDQPEVERPFRFVLQRSRELLSRFPRRAQLIDYTPESRRITRRNQFFSRMSNQGRMEDFKRVELVNHVTYMMIHVATERRSYIPWRWFNSILALASYMEMEMLNNKDFDEGDWLASFPFQIPPYEPNTFKTWNEGSGLYEDVGPPEDPGSPSKVLQMAELSLSG
ncbi:hypothetical protein F4801DRAFT_576849 [Xylaria longipes]|nr:hypothetical protein F4801DRAFT_576849 [Xylaria longipes]